MRFRLRSERCRCDQTIWLHSPGGDSDVSTATYAMINQTHNSLIGLASATADEARAWVEKQCPVLLHDEKDWFDRYTSSTAITFPRLHKADFVIIHLLSLYMGRCLFPARPMPHKLYMPNTLNWPHNPLQIFRANNHCCSQLRQLYASTCGGL